MNVIFYLTT